MSRVSVWRAGNAGVRRYGVPTSSYIHDGVADTFFAPGAYTFSTHRLRTLEVFDLCILKANESINTRMPLMTASHDSLPRTLPPQNRPSLPSLPSFPNKANQPSQNPRYRSCPPPFISHCRPSSNRRLITPRSPAFTPSPPSPSPIFIFCLFLLPTPPSPLRLHLSPSQNERHRHLPLRTRPYLH